MAIVQRRQVRGESKKQSRRAIVLAAGSFFPRRHSSPAVLPSGWCGRIWVPIWTGVYQSAIVLMRAQNLSGDALSMSMRNALITGAAPCLFVMLAAAAASLAVAMAQNRGLRLQPAGIRTQVVTPESCGKR